MANLITVTYPNGSETLERGRTHIIRWTKTGTTGNDVKIQLYKAGVNVGTIVSLTPNTGTYVWHINPTGYIGNDFKVKITSLSYPTIYDVSNNYFNLIRNSILCTFYYPWTGGNEEVSPLSSEKYRHWLDTGHNPPKTWASNYLPDILPTYNPCNELYSSKDVSVIKRHLALMKRAKIQLVISSWWGPSSYEDQALDIIFNKVLSKACNPYPEVKFCIYYELEGFGNVSKSDIISHINYVKNKYSQSPYYLKVYDDIKKIYRPVVFIYNADTGLSDAQKWKQVRDATNIYTVLKVFTGYKNYLSLADSWHEYVPAANYRYYPPYSANVSPGFHKYPELGTVPYLEREDFTRFENDIRTLKNTDVKFKIIETWNEWGEGTGIEPAQKIIHNHSLVNGFIPAAQSYGTKYIDIIAKYF